MAQGRGSARRTTALGLATLFLLIHGEIAAAETYNVGNITGWTFNIPAWPSLYQFKAGDVLVFKYDASVHDVARVDGAGYKSGKAPKGTKIYRSGNDRFTLARGNNYFICTVSGHCDYGMKLAIKAA